MYCMVTFYDNIFSATVEAFLIVGFKTCNPINNTTYITYKYVV